MSDLGNTTQPAASLPSGSDKFAELRELLSEACSLLEIEAYDHKHHHEWDNEQRLRIAAILMAFADKARAAIAKATGGAA